MHADLQCLEKKLTNTLKRGKTIATDIRLFFGNGCHPDIGDIAKRFDARLSPVKNCIDAFCGGKAKYIEQNKTMIMTPGWIRAWTNSMKSLGWTDVDVRINLGRYDKILLLDPGVDPLTDEEILMFFDLSQIPIEVEHLSLDHFKYILEDFYIQGFKRITPRPLK